MKCEYCGSDIPNSASNCPFCDAPISHDSKVKKGVPISTSTESMATTASSSNTVLTLRERKYKTAEMLGLGMKWYKFLIYITFILGPLGNLFNIYNYYTLRFIFDYAVPATNRANVYRAYPSLRTYVFLTILFSVLGIVFQLCVRKQLIEFRSKSINLLIGLYLFALVTSIYTNVALYPAIRTSIPLGAIALVVAITIIQCIVIFLNVIYFKKRSVLFSE